jgi:carbonic anhydrase/acetyltransferase-like protein (isoleucine patch superfamily)
MHAKTGTYKGKSPTFGEGVYVDPTAKVAGDVGMAENSAVWYGSLLKGEDRSTRIGSGSVVLEQCFIEDSSIGRKVILSHRALLHRCIIEDEVLVGMGAVVMDDVIVGRGSIVGAGCLVTAGSKIPPESILIGNPARILRKATDKDRRIYQRAIEEALEKTKVYAMTIKSKS